MSINKVPPGASSDITSPQSWHKIAEPSELDATPGRIKGGDRDDPYTILLYI